MADVVIDNPILNAPYDEPSRHFRFSDEGITDDVADGRRPSGYFIPVPSARTRQPQLALDTQWTQDRYEPNEAVNELYATISRPFPPPSTGRIAVKVINHYGDEVLKVYDV